MAESDCAPLFSVEFDYGSVKPRDSDTKGEIDRLARWLGAHPTATLYVDGHADPSGPEELNLVISFRRATAVASLLADAGASKSQLVVRAYGEGISPSTQGASKPERRVILKTDTVIPCKQHASK